MKNQPILKEIASARSSLRKSEIKVADFVLAEPEQVMHMRIVDLAQEAGFQEFKVRIAQETAVANNLGQFAIAEDDSIDDICTKIADTTIQRLYQVKSQLLPAQVADAAQAMSSAMRVEFYGFGASGAVATDAQHKFFRLQVATAAYSDPHMQSMSAVTLGDKDVVVAISQSGRTLDLMHSIKLAQKHGAVVVSLAPQNTPVSNAQRRGPDFANHLNAIKQSIRSLRSEGDH